MKQTIFSVAQDLAASQIVRCPVCGVTGACEFLQSQDRFHGRSNQYQLVRCLSCSLVWQVRPPCAQEMGNHYGVDYDRFIAGAKRSRDHWQRPYDTLRRYKTGGALLDLGCGSGSFLSTLNSPPWALYGIEMSQPAAEIAKARASAQVFVGDILDAPYKSGTFDVVTCFDVLEHVYEPTMVMTKVREWLKPGGIFEVLVPNIDSAEARLFGSYWYGLELPRHISHFSPESLRRVALSAGLEVVSLETHRCSSFSYSMRYVVDEAFRKIGILRAPLVRARKPGLPRRAIRKMWRLTAEPALFRLISSLGAGEQIQAVFVNGGLGSRR